MIREVVHPSSHWSFVTVIGCWLIIAYLVGNLIVALLAGLVATLLLAAIGALIKRHGKDHFIRASVNESLHSMSYALVVSLLVFVGMTNLLPPLVNLYDIIAYVVVPSSFVLFYIIHYCHHYFLDENPHWYKSLTAAGIKTVILAVLLVLGVTAGANQVHSLATDLRVNLGQGSAESIEPLTINSDLQVIQELNSAWAAEHQELVELESQLTLDCQLCAPGEVLSTNVDYIIRYQRLVQLELLTREVAPYIGQLSESIPPSVAEEEMQRLRGELAKVSEVYELESQTDAEVLFDGTFIVQLQENDAPIDFAGVEALELIALENAPLQQSAREIIVRTQIAETATQLLELSNNPAVVLRPEAMRELYENRNVDESVESKLLRYTMLVEYGKLVKAATSQP